MKIDARKHQKGLFNQATFLVTAARQNKHMATLSIAAALLVTVGTTATLTLKSTQPVANEESTISAIQTMVTPQVMEGSVSKSILVRNNIQTGLSLEDLDVDSLKDQVSSYRTVGFRGTGLIVSNKVIGFFKNGVEAESVLKAVKAPYAKETLQDLYFKEKVSLVPQYIEANHFKGFSTTEATLEMIKKGKRDIKTYVVQEGENLWGISQKLNVTLDDLLEANPSIVPEKIKAGQKLALGTQESLLTVCTVETVKVVENIPFAVSYKDNQKLFKGETKILTAGIVGKKAVEAKVIKENGIVIKNEVLSEVVLSNAKAQVVSKGTKARLTASVNGKLAKPFSRGTFSSPFGRRWGKLHKGNDFNMPLGSNILAAENGRVEKISFEKDGYGLHVIINHGNGLKTVYAHCSKILVKEGDRVTMSQKIALSGQTGRAYNPHLHFEVYKNGVAVDPMKYLSIKK